MIHKLAGTISSRLTDGGIIPRENISIYAYGMELLISSICGIVSLILISVALGHPFVWLPYLLGFVPLRVTGGGYHAKSHFKCIALFSSLFLLVTCLYQTFAISRQCLLISVVVATTVVLFFSPVEAYNKPLNNIRRKHVRASSLLFAAGTILIVFSSIQSDFFRHWFLMFFFIGYCSAAASMLAAITIKQFEKR